MKLSKGWTSGDELPKVKGTYMVIQKFHVEDPTSPENLDLIVRNGDTIVTTDDFDGTAWYDSDTNGDGWQIVAWKNQEMPELPDEFLEAILPAMLPSRESYAKEFSIEKQSM